MSASCRCGHPVARIPANAIADHGACAHMGGGRSSGRAGAPCLAALVYAHPGCLAPEVAEMRRARGMDAARPAGTPRPGAARLRHRTSPGAP